MDSTPARRMLQICPHDSAPFGDLVSTYAAAAHSLGMHCTNVYLGKAAQQPRSDAQYLDVTSLSDNTAVKAGLQALCKDPWDLVLCHRYRAYSGAMRAGVDAAKCIALAHEYGLLDRWQRKLTRLWRGRKVHFAGVSVPVAQELAQITGHSMVLPNAIDVGELRDQRLSKNNALAAMGLVPGPFTVGVVGRLHYKKRPQLALQAFEQFSQRHPRARLVFLGDGDLAQELKSAAPDNVYFTGVLTGARNYFSGFDAILYPAVADSFGMVALEALDAGVPVVCKQEHGPAYVLSNLGVYVTEDTPHGYAAGLDRVLQLDLAAQKQAGQARVERHFSVAAIARILDHLLVEM